MLGGRLGRCDGCVWRMEHPGDCGDRIDGLAAAASNWEPAEWHATGDQVWVPGSGVVGQVVLVLWLERARDGACP